MLQDVTPPQVGRRVQAHVIGNEIEDQPHAARLELTRKRFEIVVGPQFVIERIVIDDVVAVRAAR